MHVVAKRLGVFEEVWS